MKKENSSRSDVPRCDANPRRWTAMLTVPSDSVQLCAALHRGNADVVHLSSLVTHQNDLNNRPSPRPICHVES
jgi:hypothetical protein